VATLSRMNLACMRRNRGDQKAKPSRFGSLRTVLAPKCIVSVEISSS
jgi:hypothetical protein